jgi:hypothetical protein
MRMSGTRVLSAIGFTFLFALTAACGGSKPEAKAPTTDSADAPRVGSASPDLAAESTTPPASDPPKVETPAAASAANGSEIIPPFSTNKDLTPKAPTKGAKKATGAKKKKKPAATASNP